MTNPVVFIDTETTSLRPDRQAWEVAMIRRAPDGTETSTSFFIGDVSLENADIASLNIGRFFDRHPLWNGQEKRGDFGFSAENWEASKYPFGGAADYRIVDRRQAAYRVEGWTRGATLVGACPWFDAHVLSNLLLDEGLVPSWHHRLRCVESLAAGYLSNPAIGGQSDYAYALGLTIDPAKEHTALGDAETARAIWDKVLAK
jgi:hypothetical protein